MKKAKKYLCHALLAITLLGSASSVAAATFGNANSGASSMERFQFQYIGSAWNYSKSPYRYTAFKYTRNGRNLITRYANKGKVTGTVTDDLRWGDKYVTKFSWWRGPRK